MSCDIEATIDQRPINATIEGAIVNISGGAGGLIDGDYGDIAVSGAGTVWTIENMAETATVTTGTYVSNVNQALLIKARKASAGTITKGQVVYITGSSGTHLLVELARADAEATSAYTIGIACTNITNTADGYIMQNGRLTGLSTLPTASFADGDTLYLSETTAGGYRKTIPTAPNHGVFLGFVVRASNGATGEIDVRIDNYQELEELSDVYVNNEAGNDFLMRNSSNTRWENITPANVKTVLAINNVDNTSDLNKPISTATQTALNNKVDKITGKGLSTEDYTTAEKNKLAGIEAGAQVNTVTSVAGKTGAVSLVKADVGLSNVDNTSDLNKPISTATQTALDGKVNDTGDTMTGALIITGAGLTVDSADNTLVVDAVNNRVGIGTATPAQTLDVVGQVASSSFFRTNSGLTNNSSGNNATIRPQTTGTLIDRNIADGNPVLRIQNLNAGSTGDVLRLQDSSTNNLVTVDVSGQMTINGRSSSRTLNIVPQVNQSASNVIGGALRVDNTNSNGLGTLIYTNGGAGQTGRLLDINVANPAYDRAGVHMDYAGTANAFEISNTGTGTSNIALNVVSTNSGDSAVGIAGSESSRGTVKIVHNKPTGSDAGSSALSLRANGSGTAAHAIFFDAEQTGGTTGDLMLMRQNGVNTWRVDKDGILQVGTIPTARVQNLSGTNTGDQNTFSTIAVAGQSNVVADSTSDTLTLIAGSNITLTTNATNDEITIASTGGGGGGSSTPPTVTTLTNTTNTLTVGDISKIIRIDTTSNNVTATLPTAVGNTGYIFWVKRISDGSNTATIDTTSSQTIDGQSTAVLTVQYEAIGLYSNGTNWEII